MTPTKTYLGDSVYAEIENGAIKLTAENSGDGREQTIYLDARVLLALQQFVLHLGLDGEGFAVLK